MLLLEAALTTWQVLSWYKMPEINTSKYRKLVPWKLVKERPARVYYIRIARQINILFYVNGARHARFQQGIVKQRLVLFCCTHNRAKKVVKEILRVLIKSDRTELQAVKKKLNIHIGGDNRYVWALLYVAMNVVPKFWTVLPIFSNNIFRDISCFQCPDM